jgi:hypothetical protein
MALRKYNACSFYALEDISKYAKNMDKKYRTEMCWSNNTDRFFISACELKNKQTRKLNKVLGIHSINKIGNKNSSRKPVKKLIKKTVN